MVMNKLSWGSGSTRTIMYRSASLVKDGYDVSILTLQDVNNDKKAKNLRESGRLDSKVKTSNVYEDYQKRNTKGDVTRKQKRYYKKSAKIKERKLKIKTNKTKNTVKYYKDDKLLKLKKWRKNGTLSYIDYYNDNKKKAVREKFHSRRYITKKTFYAPDSGKEMHIQYFTPDGFCFLDSWSSEYMDTYKHFLHDRSNNTVQRFKDDDEFYTDWLNLLCSEESEKPFIICDKRETAISVMNMDPDNSHKIHVIHRNHFKHPFTPGSSIKTKEKRVLDRIKEHDAVVLLTEKQKVDVINEFGDYGNIRVIPHSIPHVSDEKVEKDDKTVSMVARLHDTKQTPKTIEAFQRVVQEIPDAKLELYGTGELKESLEKQIHELNLDQNVFLKGYARNTDKVYQKSLFTLLTSKYEAFSLVILESMFNGTPVISFDINYGPSDIIKDKEDGYLIKQDFQMLSDKILELLNNPEKAREMGRMAKINAEKHFNENVVMEKWEDLFSELKKKDHLNV